MNHPHLTTTTIERITTLMNQAGIKEADLQERFVLGSGSGGQKINKTSSAVLLRHVPGNIQVKCQRTRSREANRWLARRMLAEKILAKDAAIKTEKQQDAERIRRQKRRRSRRQRARMLDDKRHHAERKTRRRAVDIGE
jgi:protein subunit release factor B